jgi:hypothetical protein
VARGDRSQHGEQETILAWAGSRNGSFIDLGAYDGVTFSNTAALADRGWPGLCIEAAPDAASACARRYSDRPDVDVLLAAFDPFGGPGPALIHWTPGKMYSSLKPDRREDSPATGLLVPRVDLAWLGGRASVVPRPLFCSVDLEGDSISAARWLVQALEPDCVCVEAVNPGEREELAEVCAGWHQLATNSWNGIYAREAS